MMKKPAHINPSASSQDLVVSPKLKVTTGKRKLMFQAMIFTLTYLSYSAMHFTRSGWSILKSDVRSNVSPGLGWEGNNNAGIVDFFFLFSYSFGLFASGVLGDNFPIRIIVPIGYLTVAAMTIMITLGGTWGITSVFYYIVFFSISGLAQSIAWPSYIATMDNWFPRESRGLVFGVWCTCQNMGNIGGNVLVNILRNNANMNWMWNFRTIGIIIGVFGILNFLMLIDHPSKKGIIINLPEEEEEEETIPSSRNSGKFRHLGENTNGDG